MNSKNLNYKMNNSIISIINTKEEIEKKILYFESKKSLLLHLELHNIKIDYQCRSGYCGICRIQLIQGNILYLIKKPIASLFKKKEILPCCCIPYGNITIKI